MSDSVTFGVFSSLASELRPVVGALTFGAFVVFVSLRERNSLMSQGAARCAGHLKKMTGSAHEFWGICLAISDCG
jgi:hypothetical protein